MKATLPPWFVALVLLFGCGLYRLLSSQVPDFVPDFSPLLATSYVGALLLPRRWGWLVGPSAFLLTDFAFTLFHAGSLRLPFSSWTVVALCFYLLIGALGAFLQSRKSLGAIATGCVAGSVVFYLIANSFTFVVSILYPTGSGYPATLAGWWQANTVGLPGWPHAWVFLRNSLVGDLAFTLGLLLMLDRAWLLAQFGRRQPVPQIA